MGKNFRTIIVSAIRCCAVVGAVLTVLSLVSCKQGHVPNGETPELRNDTGINIMLTFDPNGGFWAQPAKPEEKSVEPKKLVGKKAGEPLLFSLKPQHETKVFNGWNTAGGSLPEKVPQVSTVYKAVWRALNKGEAFYTIVHLLENADDTSFTHASSEKRAGLIGSKPSADANIYEGFTYAADISSLPAAIAADGATKIEFKYKRNEVTLTFDLDGGSTQTALTGGNSLTGKWDAKLSLKTPTKHGMAFNGWNTVGGKLPERFPKVSASYKALWRDSNAPAPSPSPAADNLVKNADFAKLTDDTSQFKDYWTDKKRPASWNTWAKEANIADVHFKTENNAFLVTAGSTKIQDKAGLFQVIELSDITAGTTYTLTVTINVITNKVEGGAGGALVRIGTIPLWTKYSGNKTYTAKLTVTAEGNVSFENDKNPPQTVMAALSGKDKNQVKLECFAYGLKAGTVSFSDISLTKESAGGSAAPAPSEPSTPQPPQPPTPPPSPNTETASYTVEHWQENAADSGFTKYDADTEAKSGKVGDAPEYTPKTYPGFTYDASSSPIPPKIEASGTVVKLKYKRKQVTLTFNLDGGSTTTVLESGSTLTGKYGAPLTVAVPTKAGHTCTAWKTSGGTVERALPGTFPPNAETYTAQWKLDNLVKNADFSKLTDDTSQFKKYWTDEKRPASWNTWAKASGIAGVVFTATDSKFTVQAGNTVFLNGGIQQPITLETGVHYTLSVTVKLTNASEGTPKGGCEVKFCGKTEIKYGGTHTITFDVIGTASAKLELLAKGLQNKKVEFSAITLTKK